MVNEEFLPKKTSKKASSPKPNQRVFTIETRPNEDVIATLADHRENRRARQIYEWETLRRRSFRASA